MSTRVFIIDEHRSARMMLARRLASLPDIDVVGTACDGEEGLGQISQLHPDVVLLDTKMKKGDGLDVCRRACSTNGGSKVIVLTSYVDPDERRTAFQLGVEGYLLKDADTPKLVERIRHLTEARKN